MQQPPEKPKPKQQVPNEKTQSKHFLGSRKIIDSNWSQHDWKQHDSTTNKQDLLVSNQQQKHRHIKPWRPKNKQTKQAKNTENTQAERNPEHILSCYSLQNGLFSRGAGEAISPICPTASQTIKAEEPF